MSPLPVLATESFLRDTGHALGEEFDVSVAGRRIPITVIDAIDYFPTLDTINERYLIADLASLSRYANLETTVGEFRPNEVWLSTNDNEAQRIELLDTLARNEPFSLSFVHDRAELLAQSQVDPLVNAGWRALLFMVFAAVLILSGLGFLVHTYVSFRSREVQFALMRTIGISMRQLVTLVWVEQVLVIGAGVALGTWMGGRLGAIVMPYLGHDDQGSQVLPPYVVQVDWGTLAITYAAMALVFTLIIAGVIWFIRRISLHRVLRLGEM
jgi:ABC-type lipoprotein release transport system permease subunit